MKFILICDSHSKANWFINASKKIDQNIIIDRIDSFYSLGNCEFNEQDVIVFGNPFSEFVESGIVSCNYILAYLDNPNLDLTIDFIKAGVNDVFPQNDQMRLRILLDKILKHHLVSANELKCELNSSKTFYNFILDNLPDMVFVKDAKTLKYTYVNKATEIITGYNRNEYIGRTAKDLASVAFLNNYVSIDKKIIDGEIDEYIGEDYIPDKFGKIIQVRVQKRGIKNSKGMVKSILGIYQDITLRKHYENLHKDSELWFKALFYSSPVTVILVDDFSSKIIDVNSKFLEGIGGKHSDYLGIRLEDLEIWKDNSQIETYLDMINTTNSVTDFEVVAKTRKGFYTHYSFSAEKVKTLDKEIIIHMGIDITSRIEALHSTKASVKKLRELNTLKSSFVSMISHEFRTPLTSIILSNDILKRYCETMTEDVRNKHFNRIQEISLNMTKLLENVFLIGKIENDEFLPVPERLNIDAFCKDFINNILFVSQNSHSIIYESNLETMGDNFILPDIKLDEKLLSLIFHHLLSNAIKFSNKGTNIFFSTDLKSDKISFKIKDYGIGIDKEEIPKLFDSFYRGANTISVSGFGLGLSIVKKCVELHQGRIFVNSELGVGSEFIVELPVNTNSNDYLQNVVIDIAL